MAETKKLPKELEEQIAKQAREGIYYRFDREQTKERGRLVTAICWRPGDPNPLAAAIIRKLTDHPQPTTLILDGHEYTITPKEKD